ncbi:ABC-F family ATP-binding cassette domain-containing protein [Enterobacter roggenkampii]|jgi:ATPase subunit of ABC transporter with duplicated ATPase domains|uniref:ABC-F family ATP-binding cassette domain-containing protein n=1 Tax=Enterobacter roggenkampii TaxID=1812935 RepID=UPI001E4A3452|nr:ABC-F family ATP-binding cassette domain-containing protein [Enterobacter roggenkampii]MCE1990001.1 ATP-binding cassette domain-containing protein [Enterobacter roggenkampii]MCK6708192.1 ATP-binding cassette domain-containing protein [Enterobacter roggenkampii]MCK6910912.1 ATP-binding cassette domain-containing protein [Enterobacter roggenkampii]MCK7201516.1 ATP-binding cassette domain-containing protein [Enterobacter roggenkampii]MDD9237706.1 ABC-F family ATP-binding cassette domain-contai
MAHFAQSPSFILHQVTCQFPTGDTLFGPLNLTLEPSLCALVGRNGSGKTRLLRLLAGLDEPATGHIERFGSHAWVAQQHVISSQTTLAELLGYDAIFAARKRIDSGDYQPDDLALLDGHWDIAERLSEAFINATLPPFEPDKPAIELSGGERIRALLCGAFTAGADFLLLDEPTNHLDRQGRAWFYDQLSRYQGGVLVASHDRELLEQVPRILELSASGLRSYGGNYADYQALRDAEQQAARAALEHAATERKRTRARMQKEHDDSQRRSAKTLRTVDTLNIASFERVKYKGAAKERIGTWKKQHSEQNEALNAAVNKARERVEDDNPVMFTLPGSQIPEGKQVLVLEDLVLQHVPVPPLNWRMDGPMRVALKGSNGCGKSTLLKTLLGEMAPRSGSCKVSVSCAYLDQHLSRLDLSQSVMTHLNLSHTPLEEGVLRTRLAQLQLGADKVMLPLAALSGGERLKAALACVLWRAEATQLLLLDEPTNHLDLASVQAIEAALAGFPGALLVVSHDEAFLSGLTLTHELVWEKAGWRCDSL